MRILVVEDEEKLARFIKRGLEQEGYAVDVVGDGEKAKQQILFGEYDCVILDVMLPKKDGIQVCKEVRERNISSPILILTAKGKLEDKVEGLNAGADDYLVKPFEFDELKARVRALMRRPRTIPQDVLTAHDLILDNKAHRLTQNGKEVTLTLKEYAVLELLMRHKGQVVTRDQILDHCWGYDFDSFSNIVDVYVKRIRKKLDAYDNERYIKTVRGVGYTIPA